jgi:hypothetical protein
MVTGRIEKYLLCRGFGYGGYANVIFSLINDELECLGCCAMLEERGFLC